MTPTDDQPVWRNVPDRNAPHAGQPYMSSTIASRPDRCAAGFEHISGYTYTKLTDVEQEQNDVYFYDRNERFDMAPVRDVFSRTPDWAEL
jgi:hypothetical protein